jgi:hypothetical protein
VDTPDWQVRRERWLRQKKFGTSASIANRHGHTKEEASSAAGEVARDHTKDGVQKENFHKEVESNEDDDTSELGRRLRELLAEGNYQDSSWDEANVRSMDLSNIAKIAKLM